MFASCANSELDDGLKVGGGWSLQIRETTFCERKGVNVEVVGGEGVSTCNFEHRFCL